MDKTMFKRCLKLKWSKSYYIIGISFLIFLNLTAKSSLFGSVNSSANNPFAFSELSMNGSDSCEISDSCFYADRLYPESGNTADCITGCNDGATSNNMGGTGCYDLTDHVVWYRVFTGQYATGMNISLVSDQLTFPSISLYRGNCDSLVKMDCNAVQSENVFLIDINVKELTAYYIAVSDLNGNEGEFNLCVSTHHGLNVCNKENRVWENWSSNIQTPLGGPYFPEEEVEICYEVIAFDVASSNCQWFQAIVPSFGDGWDPSSFKPNGEPANITESINPVFQGTWSWHPEGEVHYNGTNGNLSTIQGAHGLKFCSTMESSCPGTSLNNPLGCSDTGTPLPGGWFAMTATGDQLCPFDDSNQTVDDSYGDGAGCVGIPGGWKVCFILKTRSFDDCLASPTYSDCSVNFMTFADGETGDWLTPECVGEFPAYFYALNECALHPDASIKDISLCSGDELNLLLDYDPDTEPHRWTTIPNDDLSGYSDGEGKRIQQTLVNLSDTLQSLIYYVYQQEGGAELRFILDVKVFHLPSSSFKHSNQDLTVYFTNTSESYESVLWDFGDGTIDSLDHPIHTYTSPGEYLVSIITSNVCGSDTLEQLINVQPSAIDQLDNDAIIFFPNPAKSELNIISSELAGSTYKVLIFDNLGRVVLERYLTFTSHNSTNRIGIGNLANGIYYFQLRNKDKTFTKAFIVQN